MRIIQYVHELKQCKPIQNKSVSYVSTPLHQGFKDNVYRKRRKYFADLAMSHKQWVLLRILHRYFGNKLLFIWCWENLPVAAGIPFLGLSSQRRRWRRGESSTPSLTSCTPPTPAGNTWRTFRCCPNTVTFGRTTSLSWRMCRASWGVGFLLLKKDLKIKKQQLEIRLYLPRTHWIHHQARGWLSVPTRFPRWFSFPCFPLYPVCTAQLRTLIHPRTVSSTPNANIVRKS